MDKQTLVYYAKQSVKQPLLYTIGILTAIVGYTHLGLDWLYRKLNSWYIKSPTYYVKTDKPPCCSTLDPDPYLSSIARRFAAAEEGPKTSDK